MSTVIVTPSAEASARMAQEVKYYDLPRLRWVVPPFATTERPRLQEGVRWRSAVAEGIEWRDVPTVVLEGEDRKDWGR